MKPLDFDEAKTLLEKADAAGLHALVISTEQTNAKLREVLDTLMAVYVDKPTAALHQQQNPDVIAAMRDVSLAALALAQGIAEGRDELKDQP